MLYKLSNKEHLTLSVLALLITLPVLTACNNQNADSAQSAADTLQTPTANNEQLPTETQLLAVNTHDKKQIVVHKTPTCGCCQAWVDYLEEEGFAVETHNHDSVNPIKQSLGMNDPEIYSCHTAIVDGYIIEGHVPVDDINKLLKETPDIAGLTAPGMPMLSPGMNSRTPKDYAVLSFTKNNETKVYSQY